MDADINQIRPSTIKIWVVTYIVLQSVYIYIYTHIHTSTSNTSLSIYLI